MFASVLPLVTAVTADDGLIALHPQPLIAWAVVGLVGLVAGVIAVRVSARHLESLENDVQRRASRA